MLQVRNALQNQLGFSEPADALHETDLSGEIAAFRKLIREEKYFFHPLEDRVHVSLDRKKMDHELVNMNTLAITNKDKYGQEIRRANSYVTVKLQPVFVTKEEREKFCKIENKTKDEIETEILSVLLVSLERVDDGMAEQYREYYHTNVKRKRKQIYIDFYYEVLSATDEAVAMQMNVDEQN
ncbi:MAG: hypothetical protein N0C90_11075 [Candidatus Thiodiazotropha endolucinida]|nr:hypothetical protein [Candidatus Thiodiazotropha taylori]MCW4261902.1 hypothetical protein [Candidatus Thiodiazotropha endolucinida]